MRNFFNMEGPLFTGLNKFADMVILNLLFLLCCIPIITIGASLSAMYYVQLKMRDGEEGYVARTFFRGFKRNFKQATIVWLGLLAIAFVLYVDVRMTIIAPQFRWMRVIIYIGAVLWLMVMLYIFPMIARFVNSTGNMLRNSLLLALGNAPKTLLMMAVTVGSVLLTFLTQNTLVWGLFIWLVVGFSFIAWINTSLIWKIFEKISPHEEEEADTGNDEEWTLPDEDVPAREAPEKTE